MKPVVFLGSARNDLRSEKSYYLGIDPELGRRFGAAVEYAVRALSHQPLAMRRLKFSVRRWPIGHGFPHGIFYRVNETQIIVLSIFHPKRDPETWRRRARF